MIAHSPLPHDPAFQRGARIGAFTLIELLLVIAVIGIMTVLLTPAVTGLAQGGKFSQTLIAVSGAFEKARAHAVANNTYTYVGFTDPNTNGIYMGIFGSADGTSGVGAGLTNNATATINNPKQTSDGSPLMLLDRLTLLESCKLQNDVTLQPPLSTNSALTGDASPLASGMNFTYQSGAYGSLTFTRIVQFTPDGEARVAQFTPAAIRAVLTPIKGNTLTGTPDTHGESAIQITGLTGQVNVYRP